MMRRVSCGGGAGRAAAQWMLSLAFAASVAATAQADEIALETTVSAARVYPQGATVTRSARFEAGPGRHELIAADLPLRIDPATLRVRLLAGAQTSLLGIRYRRPQAQPPQNEDPEREALEDAIEDLEWRQREAIDAIGLAQSEQAYVEALRKATAAPGEEHGGGDLLDRLAQWPAAWSQLSEAHAQAQADARAASREADEIEEQLADLRDQLADLAPEAPRGALIATIRADAAVSDGVIEVSYLTGDARWRPLYDLRLTSAEGDAAAARLALVRRAAVSQRSGEDWEDIALTLSTAQPSAQMVVFEPPETEARFAQPTPELAIAGAVSAPAARSRRELQQHSLSMADEAAPAASLARSAPVQAVAAFEGAQVSFTAPDLADLSGDGEVAQIFLLEAEQEVVLEARTTPALDPTAYLYALYLNDQTPILPGQAAIFRDDVFVGRTRIEAAAPAEEAPLPLGPLDEIKVSRRLRERMQGEEGVFVSENRRRARFEITVENLGAQARQVVVYEGGVFTENDDIEIALQASPRPTERDVADRRGTAMWRLDLAPGARREIAFGYDITWPDGEEIELITGGPRPF